MTAPDFPLQTLLWQHLLDPSATPQQRAAILRHLSTALGPQLGSTPQAETQPSTSSTTAELAASDTHHQSDTSAPAGVKASHQGGSTSASHDSSPEPVRALQYNLLAGLLAALPSVLVSAVSPRGPSANAGSSSSSSNSSVEASNSSAQSEDTDILQAESDAGHQEQSGQQEAGVDAVDGNAMHTLLKVLLQAAGEYGSQGALSALGFPAALAAVLPELLASPRVSNQLFILIWVNPILDPY